jgi:AcrR family transcriptional regulator
MAARMKAAARRLQILETAARCFAEHGYRGTTTALLAKAAGITEPILYRHFANKHDLFIALTEWVGEEVFSNWREAIRDIPSPLGQLREILYRNPATADPVARNVYRVMFHASTEFTEPRIQDAIREHYRKYLRFLSKIVHRAQEAGEVRHDVTAEMLAWQIIHAAVGFAMARMLDISGHETSAFVDETIRVILEMLAPRTKTNAAS